MDVRPLNEWIVVVVCLFIGALPNLTNAESRLSWLKLTPEVLDSDKADVALGFKFDLNANGKTLLENDTLTLDYVLKGEWASEEDFNTDPIEAKVEMGFDKLTYITEGDIYYYGQINAGFASDDRLEEQELAGGVTAAVSYAKSRKVALDFLGHYSWVYSMESERREQLGGDDTDDFGRLEFEALAVWRLREYISTSFIRNLKISGNYRYFYQHNLDGVVEEAGEDSFDYIKVDLAYEWWPNALGLIQEVFVSYSYGHLQTQVEDQSVWTVGVVFYGASGFGVGPS